MKDDGLITSNDFNDFFTNVASDLLTKLRSQHLIYKILVRVTMLVTILLRNGLTDFYEILYAYLVGLRIGYYLSLYAER